MYEELKKLAEYCLDERANHEDFNIFATAANPSAVLALIAENERLAAQWGDRPAYRTPEYESKRDSMWRRAHMVATSKGYDHINMAIAAAPRACAACHGCGGEWQGDDLPNSVCDTCKGSRGKALEAENEELRKALADVREALGREYWDQYAGLDETRDILDAALGKEGSQ